MSPWRKGFHFCAAHWPFWPSAHTTPAATAAKPTLLEPYSVDLVAEEGADDLELALVLRLGREAGQDRVVGRDGLDLPAEQPVDTVAVAGEPDQVDRGPVLFLDPVARRGSLAGTHFLALEVICLLDAAVIRAHEDVLVGDVIRPGKRHHLL